MPTVRPVSRFLPHPLLPPPMRAIDLRCALLLRRMLLRAVILGGIIFTPARAIAQKAASALPSPDSAGKRLSAPFATLSVSAQSMRDSIVSMARAQVGTRYVLGGETPDRGFDCSGLVRYLLAAWNVALPRTAAQQARSGVAVSRDTTSLRPGDLLTFGRGKRASHIGIYVGNGRFVHASSKAGRVVESNLHRAPARGIKPLRGARRFVVTGDSAIVGRPG